MITRHRGEFEVRLMCRVLEVSPSGYYASRKRSPSWHALIDEVLMARVRMIHRESGDTYGAPRVHRELQAEGLPASPKRVARLMREDGLVARPRKRPRVSTTDSNHDHPIAPNLLARAVRCERRWYQPRLGGRHHVHPDARRRAVLGDRARSGVAPMCWVGDARQSRSRVGLERAPHGAGVASSGPWADSPFGSRESIHGGRLPRRVGRARHAGEHERQGRLLRQRRRRELFLDARV